VKILVVDDDAQLRLMLRYALEREDIQVEEASSGEAALDSLRRREPDVVLLDVHMPGMGGIEACRRIREQSAIPIIMLSADGTEDAVVVGLRAGADDYCAKPVGLAQLFTRIQALLRRRRLDTAPAAGISSFPNREIVLDPTHREAIVQGRTIRLSARAFDLLQRLAQSPGRVVSHEELLDHLWGTTTPDCLPQLRSSIKLLRQKIEPDPYRPRYIRSHAGVGYVLETSAGQEVGPSARSANVPGPTREASLMPRSTPVEEATLHGVVNS